MPGRPAPPLAPLKRLPPACMVGSVSHYTPAHAAARLPPSARHGRAWCRGARMKPPAICCPIDRPSRVSKPHRLLPAACCRAGCLQAQVGVCDLRGCQIPQMPTMRQLLRPLPLTNTGAFGRLPADIDTMANLMRLPCSVLSWPHHIK